MTSPGRALILVENLSVPFDQRVWREATALREMGWQVNVICPRGEKFDREPFADIDGIEIHRYPGWEAKDGVLAFGIEFLIALVMMTIYTFRVAMGRGFDVIQTCNPPDLLFLVTLPYKLFGKKVIFDHHDLSPETYQTKKNTQDSDIVHKLLLQLEAWTFATADVVISTNESYKRFAIERGHKSPDDVVVVRNGPDPKRVRIVEPDESLKRGKQHLVYYIGTMGSQDGVDYLLHAVHEMARVQEREDFHCIVMGGGIALEDLEALATKLGIQEHISFTGRVPDEAVVRALSTATVCVCPDPDTPLNNVSTMNKTMEYMAVAKPVVAFDLVETRFSAQDAALYAENNSPRHLAECIAKLLDDPELREELGRRGKQRVDEFLSWEHSKPHLRHAYERALSK